MKRRHLKFITLIGLLLITTLACARITEWTGRAREVQSTAQSAVADIQAFATRSAELQSTAQAFATQNPSMVGTAQAFFTEQGPSLLATAQAAATDYPGALETVQALITQGVAGEAQPPDIPLPPGELEKIYGTHETIAFNTSLDFQAVLSFYTDEMIVHGWGPVAAGTMQAENTAVLNYSRSDRNASITINHNVSESKTLVVINVQGN
jgi:hypothetical protein